MGAILFLILRLIGMIDTPVDLSIFCVLISIDSIGVPTVLKLIKK